MQRGLSTKPANLTIEANIDAVALLKKEKPASFDHIYTHFLLQHLPRQQRAELYREMWRTLRPGGKIKVLEELRFAKLFAIEFGSSGFSVSSRAITTQHAVEIGTFHALRNAAKWKDMVAQYASFKAKYGEDAAKVILLRAKKEHVLKLDRKMTSRDETPDTKVLLRCLGLINDRPFMVITATKGRVRQMPDSKPE